MAVSQDLFFASIPEIHERILAKEITSEELTRAFAARLEKLGPRYNADNPLHAETVLKVRDAALRHGKIPGVHTNGSALTNRYIHDGFKMVMLTADTACMTTAAKGELNAIQDALKEVKV